MSPTLEALGIHRLTIEQRIALAQEILDTVVAEQPARSLSDAKRLELQRRLAAHAATPDDVVPWDEIESAALARFAK